MQSRESAAVNASAFMIDLRQVTKHLVSVVSGSAMIHLRHRRVNRLVSQ